MNWWDRLRGRTPVPVAGNQRALDLNSVYGQFSPYLDQLGLLPGNVDLPVVTVDSALQVPAVLAAVTFLSRALASIPLHLVRIDGTNAKRMDGGLATLLRDAPNAETTSFEWRKWFWEQVFTGGRGLSWIERNGAGQVVGIWQMDPCQTRIERRNGQRLYWFAGQADPYTASDVIDLTWMSRSDGIGHYSPVQRAARSIAKALAMMDYGARLFAKGGVPPLALVGPPATGAEALRRSLGDVAKMIDIASQSGIPIAPIPSGFELKPIGFNPKDGQMTEEAKAINLDFARVYNLPPVFLQDLQFASYTNSEQQDLTLVKHVLRGWAEGFEQQLNLKLFGPKKADRRARHDFTELMRADFKSLTEGLRASVFGGVMTPNEARARMDLPASPQHGADDLHMQGATVPLGSIASTNGTGNPNGGNGNGN